MFYGKFLKICESKGVSPTRVLNELGISKSSYGHWKKGGEPLNETKKKIADYFGITIAQLMAGDIENVPAPVQSEDNELNELLEEARRNPDLRILFSLGVNATKEEVKKYIKMIKVMCGDDEDGQSDC